MSAILIKDAQIINEGTKFRGSLLIKDGIIEDILPHPTLPTPDIQYQIIDANGKLLIPGVVDNHVHFREPGLTHKGDLHSESRAAVAGGITSFMDMPNVSPKTTTQQLLEERFSLAAEKSLANYSFYLGATNNNLEEIIKTNPRNVCGIKLFMGSSTGNMLVDQRETLSSIFEKAPLLIAVHCEDTPTIDKNLKEYQQIYGDDIPMRLHGKIRNEEACYKSSLQAIQMATKYNTRLHILHLSSARELELLDGKTPAHKKKITGEVCVHHLWFDDRDYDSKGAKIRWNPAIKSQADKNALLKALQENKLDTISTDHAPHTLEEKSGNYMNSAGGGPMVQHSLTAMLELSQQGKITIERVVEKMCHNPAEIFQVEKRGFIRKGYHADLVLLSEKSWRVNNDNLLYKCGWSPMEGETFHYSVEKTFVNGHLVYDMGVFDESVKGQRLTFER